MDNSFAWSRKLFQDKIAQVKGGFYKDSLSFEQRVPIHLSLKALIPVDAPHDPLFVIQAFLK
jgi:hypothetical protein